MTVSIDENGMALMTTDDAVESIIESTFQSLHTRGVEPEKDAKIEEAYLKFTGGIPMLVEPIMSVRHWYLRGATGQGKTQAMQSACRKIAAWLGANFVYRPSDNYTPTQGDFVFNVLELAGEVSNMSTAGVVNVQEFEVNDEKIKFVSKVPLKMLAGMKLASYGFLLLDDFANAAINVQTSLLSALLDKKLGALDLGISSCFGLAGNVGISDGTKGIANTSSITSRVFSAIIYDTLENFTARTLNYYQNECGGDFGDAHYCSFLEAYPEHFFQIEKTRQGWVPFPTSRMHEAVIAACRRCLHTVDVQLKNGVDDPYSKALDQLFTRAVCAVGGDVASSLKHFYTCMLHYKAAPLARDIILEGKVDDESVLDDIQTRLGGMTSSDEMYFSSRFSQACGDYASAAMASAIKNNDMKRQSFLLGNLAVAVFGALRLEQEPLVMDEGHSRDLMSHFIRRLAILVDDRKHCFIDPIARKPVVHDSLAKLMESVFSQNQLALRKDPVRGGEVRLMTLFADVITNSTWRKHGDFNVSDATLNEIKSVLPSDGHHPNHGAIKQ
ncbi:MULTISPECIES: hypothetical protein [Aeromonas]|uniref:Uncharacterized protein n=1 Tax=Aeromonas veronii TaxID=654 RepID=A0A4S5CD18_AERVE|nr:MULTISPECIES: hypothetical protein [Aeromonas]THJ43687.1 hypothetical protein E8Q35_15395 [Aeromonas veronii]